MKKHLSPVGATKEQIRVANLALHDLSPDSFERIGVRALAGEGRHLVAFREQFLRKSAADESCGACDKTLHGT